MSTSGDVRPLRQSEILPLKRDNGGWDIDQALSVEVNESWLFFILTLPPLDGDPKDDEFSDLEQQLRLSHAETNHVKKENKDLQKKCKDLEKKNKDLHKENEDLHKKIKDLQSAQANLKLRAELREILGKTKSDLDPKLKLELNVALMKEARKRHPKEFPLDIFPQTFTGTVAALVNEKANKSTKYKLDLLRDVAKAFRSNSLRWWDADMGELFFILCKSVAQWNNVDFHPKIEKEKWHECKDKAEKGMYIVDNFDLKKLVIRLLHT